jgi:hypothetical protein
MFLLQYSKGPKLRKYDLKSTVIAAKLLSRKAEALEVLAHQNQHHNPNIIQDHGCRQDENNSLHLELFAGC